MKKLASLEVKALVEELQPLKDAKISNLYLPSKKKIILVLHKKDKLILVIDAEKGVYLIDDKKKQGEATGLCKFLRKNLNNSRILSINQKCFERIIEIEFSNQSKFIIELFSKGNISLVEEGIIRWVAQPEEWGARSLRVGKKYEYAELKPDLYNLSLDEFSDIIKKSEKENIVKCLALEFGLGGKYAEEVCSRAGVDKEKKDVTKANIKKIFGVIHNFEIKDVSLGLVEDKKEDENMGYLNVLKKLELIKKNQERKLVKVSEEISKSKEIGDYIYTKFNLVDEIINEVKESKFKSTRKEIKKILPKERKVVVEI